MFIDLQDKRRLDYYQKMLCVLGSLSRLFSESNEPYIQYRIAENLFCKAFDADNLSRTDCSADASKDGLGIGIKTFLEHNGATMQKIAEFNSEHTIFKDLELERKIQKIAELRNSRIEATKRIFDLRNMIYHCVTRKKGGAIIYESPMDLVDLENIRGVELNRNIISFQDGLNEYAFNITKSTLYKRFNTPEKLLEFDIEILENPFEALEKLLLSPADIHPALSVNREDECITLPLYSPQKSENIVHTKSGLNQWNASGRRRDYNEVYIPIPAWIHRAFPSFFPKKDTPFTLLLPNKTEMSAKICQDGSKALMSNPNSALGEWLLRDVLGLKEGELLTYDRLRVIGLDSVIIYKTRNGKYDIDFTKIGSYEAFKNKHLALAKQDEDAIID